MLIHCLVGGFYPGHGLVANVTRHFFRSFQSVSKAFARFADLFTRHIDSCRHQFTRIFSEGTDIMMGSLSMFAHKDLLLFDGDVVFHILYAFHILGYIARRVLLGRSVHKAVQLNCALEGRHVNALVFVFRVV